MAIENIDQERCTGCEICIESCSTDVLRMDERTGKAYIAYPKDCHSCSLCESDCPEGAIRVSFITIIPQKLLPY